ncbi:MAG TPA: hypothetical protein VFQ53_22595 [Kofleriaceae bacterium]|nr:hypothetical protein [Kofleriaceae bacterium]
MRRVLCISGKRFSGKDTLAGLLVDHARSAGIALATYAFAAESKRLFAESRDDVDLARLLSDRDYKERWRPALTQFTVDSIAADPLVFCRAVADRIAASAGPALITDLRLRLELDHLRTRFAPYVVRVVRPDPARAAAGWVFDEAKDRHHTETELDERALWDEVVDNSGSLAELSAQAASIVSRLVT